MDKVALGSASVALLAFYNTLEAQFVYDDARAILQNDDLLASSPLTNLLTNDFWGTPLKHSGSHKSYRPLCTLTFRLNQQTTGFSAFYFHLVNVLLHALATYLFVLYIRKVFRPKTSQAATIISGLLFALHPIHTEAVAGIVGRADILASVFFLLALLAYQKHVSLRDYCCSSASSPHHYRGHSEDYGSLVFAAAAQCDKNGNALVGNGSKHGSKKHHHLQQSSSSVLPAANNKDMSYLALTAFLAGCSMFSKEQGVTVLAVCFATDLFQQQSTWKSNGSRKIKSLLCLAFTTAVLLATRARLMGFTAPKFAKADNPASAEESFWTRTMTFFYLPAFNLWLLLCPSTLSFDWSMDAIPLVKQLSDPRNLASLALLLPPVSVGLSLLKKFTTSKKKNVVLFTSLCLLVLPFLPATNLLFYVGFVVAERILYIPSMGFCMLAGHCIGQAIKKSGRSSGGRKMVAICATTILLLSYGLKTVQRNNEWRDEESLYRSGLSINPAKALGNLGNVLTQKGRLAEAEASFNKAIQHRPNMADVHYNLGVLLQQQNRLWEAARSYKNAIHFRPKLALAHLNLGLTYSALGDKQSALATLKRLETIGDDGLKDPKTHLTTQVTALFNAGKLLVETGQPKEAVALLRKAEMRAKTVNYQAQGILNVLGEAYQALNRTAEAELYYRAALNAKPDHIPAYLTYGKLLAKNKTRHGEAEEWFSKANNMAPRDPSVHLHYGLFLMDLERNMEAAKEFALAAELKPDDFESVFNAGVAFRQAGQKEMAEKYYRKAVALKPQDPSTHMNLGAMLHLVGKLVEAEDHYLKALQLKPQDQAATINIQRLHRVMKARGIHVRLPEEL